MYCKFAAVSSNESIILLQLWNKRDIMHHARAQLPFFRPVHLLISHAHTHTHAPAARNVTFIMLAYETMSQAVCNNDAP